MDPATHSASKVSLVYLIVRLLHIMISQLVQELLELIIVSRRYLNPRQHLAHVWGTS